MGAAAMVTRKERLSVPESAQRPAPYLRRSGSRTSAVINEWSDRLAVTHIARAQQDEQGVLVYSPTRPAQYRGGVRAFRMGAAGARNPFVGRNFSQSRNWRFRRFRKTGWAEKIKLVFLLQPVNECAALLHPSNQVRPSARVTFAPQAGAWRSETQV
jgi:hypothetical protein